jgi:thioredoxin-like negative regulator of GroEL
MKPNLKAILVIAGIAGLLLYLLTGGGMGTPDKPVAGQIYRLTPENLRVAQRAGPLLALYTRSSEQPSKQAMLSLARRAGEHAGKAFVAHGDVELEPKLFDLINVRMFPTWIIYKNGIEVARVEGEAVPRGIEAMVAEHLPLGKP